MCAEPPMGAHIEGVGMSKKPTKPQIGYLDRVISQALATGIKPGVHHVIVEHELTCPALNGEQKCTCKPEISICEGSA
jgi:hypothetical protein